jgi:hypothetical protein
MVFIFNFKSFLRFGRFEQILMFGLLAGRYQSEPTQKVLTYYIDAHISNETHNNTYMRDIHMNYSNPEGDSTRSLKREKELKHPHPPTHTLTFPFSFQ